MRVVSFLLVSLLLISWKSDVDCSSLRKGRFIIKSEVGNQRILRTKQHQYEIVPELGIEVVYDIKWFSNCSYALFNCHVEKGKEYMNPKKTDTIYGQIISIEDDYHIVRTSSNFRKETLDVKIYHTK